jgi:hypothetical protein
MSKENQCRSTTRLPSVVLLFWQDYGVRLFRVWISHELIRLPGEWIVHLLQTKPFQRAEISSVVSLNVCWYGQCRVKGLDLALIR